VSATSEGVQTCRECGQPLLPQTTKDQPTSTHDSGSSSSTTVDVEVKDVCVNQSCPRFGTPNDPFEDGS
jgi:hypothetical protein